MTKPEPGAWVTDTWKDMPSTPPPEPLPKGKLTAGEIRDDYISYEGLGFCVYTYIPASKIQDVKLANLWRKARSAMQAIVEHLETVSSPQESRRKFGTYKKKKKKKKAERRETDKQTIVKPIIDESLELEEL